MRWTPGGSSDDVEDDRGSSGGGGGGFNLLGGRSLGLGGLLLVGALSLVFHQNFFSLLSGGGGQASTATPGAPVQSSPAEDKQVQFVTFVLNDVQSSWTAALPNYQHAKLVLYRDGIQSGCGDASSSMGPFYCPADRKVYLDLGFFQELRTRYGAPGEFAEAYVIAHEVGHHVQKLLGIEDKVTAARRRDSSQANALSVRLELQADCFAGVWAHSTEQRNILEKGDIESAMGAAAAVGDDRLQRAATGSVHPEKWTHGSSAERTTWFKRGMDKGDIAACDTFARSD